MITKNEIYLIARGGEKKAITITQDKMTAIEHVLKSSTGESAKKNNLILTQYTLTL